MPGRALLVAALLAAASAAGAEELSALLALVRDGASAAQRLEAVRALRAQPTRGPQSFAALAAAMSGDLSNEVRQEAAIALLDYPGGETTARLEAFFKDERGDEARRAVCAAMSTAPAHVDDPGVTSLLTGLLAEDAAPGVRAAAASALLARQDRSALGELRRAAARDQDRSVREAASAALRALSRPPRSRKAAPPKPRPVPYDAVKGRDHCPAGSGWCECERPPLKTKPRCVAREDCEHAFYNSYQTQGFACTWNGTAVR